MADMKEKLKAEKIEAVERIQNLSKKKLTEMAVKHDKYIISI